MQQFHHPAFGVEKYGKPADLHRVKREVFLLAITGACACLAEQGCPHESDALYYAVQEYIELTTYILECTTKSQGEQP